jgi:5-methylcytosine-specific restriction enzyme A
MNPRAAKGGWCDVDALPKGPSGRALCRHCAVEVPAGRRTFCSQRCVHLWKMRTNPGYVRQQVWERDHGLCAQCGIDTGAKRARGTGHLWQADHIVPVAEGGGLCGLEGYRTLCFACHAAVTADLMRRLRVARAGVPKPLNVEYPMD